MIDEALDVDDKAVVVELVRELDEDELVELEDVLEDVTIDVDCDVVVLLVTFRIRATYPPNAIIMMTTTTIPMVALLLRAFVNFDTRDGSSFFEI